MTSGPATRTINPASPAAFWNSPELPAQLTGEPPAIPAGAAVLKRLGKFPFWRGSQNLVDALQPLYLGAAAVATQIISESAEAPAIPPT